MTDFKGSSGDSSRMKRLAKQREAQQKEFEERRKKIKEEAKMGVLSMRDKFATHSDAVEESFKRSTVGLVSHEQFKKTRERLESLAQKERERQERALNEKKRKRQKIAKAQLSFALEEEEEEEEEKEEETTEKDKPKKARAEESKTSNHADENGERDYERKSEEERQKTSNENDTTEEANSNNGNETNGAPKKIKYGKNPFVDTTFLPDREREEEERRVTEQLRQQWETEQEKLKNEIISVTYSYYDGTGHRRTLNIKKGTRIDQFLEMVRQEFHELRGLSAEHLLFIKEDVIIPQHYTFYDLIVTKAKGKSGPLWNWDVHDDVRVINDAKVEKDESHAAKVVERRWYERNKHIFPASRWEVYDPAIKRERYTIHGD
ncbi:Protein fam50a [Balamuthia mandrillaris]